MAQEDLATTSVPRRFNIALILQSEDKQQEDPLSEHVTIQDLSPQHEEAWLQG